MTHVPSESDRAFVEAVEACTYPVGDFDHAAHIRLAFVYLADHGVDGARDRMEASLRRFLGHHGVDPTKYHETLTQAWLRAVRHFMEVVPGSDSAEAFMRGDERMLDSKIMLTHYSAELLFSDDARRRFVEPDVSAIPAYED